MLAQFFERVRQIVNRIVGPGPAGVAARVASGEGIGLARLLGSRDRAAKVSELLVKTHAAAVGIKPELRLRQVAPLGRSQRRADAARFLIAAVKEYDVAIRLEALGHEL